MKRLILFGGLIILLSRCSHHPVETNNNSGLLQSITSYGGDSAQAGLLFQKFGMNYDNQARVTSMTFYSNNLTVEFHHNILFFYNGNDQNPNLMVDSLLPNTFSYDPYIRMTYFFFDNAGNKIKDSALSYYRTSTPPYTIYNYQPVSSQNVYYYTYQPSKMLVDYRGITGVHYPQDTFYFNSQNLNDRKNGRITYYETMNIDYYDATNPLGSLNISKALFNVFTFMGANFHPYNYDMNYTMKLPKIFTCRYYDVTDQQTMNLNLYFDKNASSKVNKIVMAKRRYRYPSGTLFDFYYTNYAFDYYP